jgi:hypothetical protein
MQVFLEFALTLWYVICFWAAAATAAPAQCHDERCLKCQAHTQNPSWLMLLYQVLLPHRHDVMIEGVSLGSRWLVLSLRSNAQQSLVAYQLPEDGSMPTQLSNGQVISFDEAAYELSGGERGGTQFCGANLCHKPLLYSKCYPQGSLVVCKCLEGLVEMVTAL